MATSAELAEESRSIILKYFTDWDTDDSGTIDRDELRTIVYQLSAMTEEDVDKLLTVIDVNKDGIIDFKEFVAWITDRQAQSTVGEDGWIEKFDLKSLLRPLFEVFDKNDDGTIQSHELEECATIMKKSLSLHPLSSGNGDLLAIDLDNFPTAEKITFEDFVKWQSEILQNSGIPNNRLPHLMKELAESLDIIFHIDSLHQKQENDSSAVHDALQQSIQKVADTTRKLYTEKPEMLQEQEEWSLGDTDVLSPTSGSKCWRTPPTANDISKLARFCAKKTGVRLETHQEPGSLEPSSAARRMSSTRTTGSPDRMVSRRSSASLRPGSGTGSMVRRPSLGKRLDKLPARQVSIRSEVHLAIGQMVICIPDKPRGSDFNPWLVKVKRQSVADGKLVDETVIYRLRTVGGGWSELSDGASFDQAMAELPNELKLFALLKAQALMGNQLSWFGAKTALQTAENMGIIDEELIERYEDRMMEMAEEHMRNIHTEEELKHLDKSVKDAAYEYLEDLKKSPPEVLAVLAELAPTTRRPSLVIDPETWAQLLACEPDQFPASP
eukprot:TRINITY_DN51395_c0_g1_i1.p1 TRINITY_DN51395_c0_g1~~TRINITY_DN51395_c0_g1_i1.p1  ORF type:complete len:554 (-),score=139.18 TRINITY_DN51395_c0_g1_i1:29-1690(-)